MLLGAYAVDLANIGWVSFLFPGWKVVREPLNAFEPDANLIVVSERSRDFYPSKNVILVTRKSDVKLDSREGFLKFLRDRGVKITEEHEHQLMNMEEADFWALGKQMHVMHHFYAPEVERSASIFELFKSLFEDFSVVYRFYRKSGAPHKVVFSSLLTMMLKTQQTEIPGISAGYKKALMANKLYFSNFQRAVLNYLDTDMEDNDFVSLLLECSEAKRGAG